MRSGTLRIGLASPRVATTREDGLATVGRFLTEAAAQGAAIVCFPETYLPGYRGLDVLTPPPDQRAQERALLGVRAVARQHRVAVIMPMEWASPGGLLNLAVVVNADGTIQGYQTKNQLAPEEEPHYVPGETRRLFVIDETAMIARVVENTIYFASVNYALRYQQTATSLLAPDGTCVGHTAYGEEALLVADLDPEAATGLYARRYAPDRYGE